MAKITHYFVFLFLLAPAIIGGPVRASDSQFYLSVRLNDPYNPDLLVRLPIKIDKQFTTTVQSDNVKTTISGILAKPESDKYPLALTVLEWSSAESNIGGTTEYDLDLDKPCWVGAISSFVYLRKVTLSKKRPSLND